MYILLPFTIFRGFYLISLRLESFLLKRIIIIIFRALINLNCTPTKKHQSHIGRSTGYKIKHCDLIEKDKKGIQELWVGVIVVYNQLIQV